MCVNVRHVLYAGVLTKCSGEIFQDSKVIYSIVELYSLYIVHIPTMNGSDVRGDLI